MAFEWFALVKSTIGYPIAWLTKRFQRPELGIEVKFNNSLRGSRGSADMSQYAADGICLVTADELIQAWEISWNYTLDITNNSEHTATNLLLVVPESELHDLEIQPTISHTKPLKAGETKQHSFKYRQRFIGTHIAADTIVDKFPFDVIELKYKNSTKLFNFFTKYRHSEKIENRNEHGMTK